MNASKASATSRTFSIFLILFSFLFVLSFPKNSDAYTYQDVTDWIEASSSLPEGCTYIVEYDGVNDYYNVIRRCFIPDKTYQYEISFVYEEKIPLPPFGTSVTECGEDYVAHWAYVGPLFVFGVYVEEKYCDGSTRLPYRTNEKVMDSSDGCPNYIGTVWPVNSKDYETTCYQKKPKVTFTNVADCIDSVTGDLISCASSCDGSLASTEVPEICGNNIDDNCNGYIDEEGCEDPTESCDDADEDGFFALDETNCTEGTDCDDTDAEIGEATLWYADADNDGHSSGETALACERPYGYKSADELEETSGDCDDTDDKTNPGAEETCDGKDNNCDADKKVDEGCCEGRVEVLTFDIWPKKTGGNTTADVSIKLFKPAPPSGCVVSLKVKPPTDEMSSGGHNHYNGRSNHTGKILSSTGSEVSKVEFKKDEIGPKVVKFKSSEVSGIETIKASFEESNTVSEAKLVTRVLGLSPLMSSIYYRQTGFRGIHPVHHYGTQYTRVYIYRLAAEFNEKFKATLGINDLSLIWGGMFDYKGDWNTKAHYKHRKGTSVDIDQCALTSPYNASKECKHSNGDTYKGFIKVDKKYVGDLCVAYGDGYLVREASIHCEYPY
ncbi:MAG: putative metal-binding motif-containing protein [Deltaproteobacteria bacterium]|nr:putative metal-binding motif-containing protein [Deltaproteobacteria bacterium]